MVLDTLRQVHSPELGVDTVSLGLLADAEVLSESAWSPEDMSPEAREALG